MSRRLTRPDAPPGFSFRRLAGGLEVLAASALRAPHAFTLAGGFGRRDRAESDLRTLREGLGVAVVRHFRQVHGVSVRVLPGGGDAPADGAVLAEPGEAVAVKTADCVPILIHAPASGFVAVAHAGWRGTVAGVAGAAVRTLAAASGEAPAAMVAATGPAIGPCCFEVGPEVPDAFRRAGRPVPEAGRNERSGRPHLDLPGANRAQLEETGLDGANVRVATLCTRCGPGFHSYRRDGAGCGRNWSVIANPGPAQATSRAARSAWS